MFKKVSNWLKFQKRTIEKKIFGDSILNGRMVIENAKSELEKIGGRICEFAGHVKSQEKSLLTLNEESARWEQLAKKAAEANIENDVRIAVRNKVRVVSTIVELEKQLCKDNEILETIQEQYREQQNRLCKAEKQFLHLSIRKENAKIRKEMKAAVCGLKSNSSLAQLDNFEKEVNKEECEVEAIEEMANERTGDSIETMEEKYDTKDNDTIEEEVQRLLNK